MTAASRDGAASTNGRRPLRVLHIITRMIVGGAQENTMLSCALIDQARFPSELLTGPQTGSEGELHGEVKARGVTMHIEPTLVRELDLWKDLVALFRLHAFIKRGRYDVVHTHSATAGGLGRVAARLAGVPVIVHTLHGVSWNKHHVRFPGIAVWIEKMCARWSDAMVAVAETDRQEAIALGIGVRDRFELIRSGIEVEAYRDVAIDRTEARARLGIPLDAFVVGSVGRLNHQKAPLELLAAFGRLAEMRPEARLVMVGDGAMRDEVHAWVAKSPHRDRIHLLGLRRDVPEILRALDVFALASHYEGLPRVFPQAMAAGLPIVATRVAGAVDAVIPGENGWLVDIGDMEAMARHLDDLARDPAQARRMGERGRSRAEEFSARRMVQQLEVLYARLAAEKGLIVAES